MQASAAVRLKSTCRSREDFEYESGDPGQGLNIYIHFRMNVRQHRELFVQANYYNIASSLSDIEFVSFIHKSISDAIRSPNFKSRLLGQLMLEHSVILMPSYALIPNSSAEADIYDKKVWRPVSYWNWLRQNLVLVTLLQEKDFIHSHVTSTLAEPIATSIFGEKVGADILQPESACALLNSFLLVISALGVFLILKWYKNRKVMIKNHGYRHVSKA